MHLGPYGWGMGKVKKKKRLDLEISQRREWGILVVISQRTEKKGGGGEVETRAGL